MFLFLTDAAPGPHNVMLDLETWGTAPGCAIRSVGAIMFDPHGDEMGAEFYMNVNAQSCQEKGLPMEEATVEWWRRQSQQAQDALAENQRPIVDVVVTFHQWFRRNGGIFVWSQGGNFDEPLWSAVCRAVGLQPPWKFWDTRCTRTAYDMGGFDPRSIRRQGTYHNALDDARHQARCVQAAYRNVEVRRRNAVSR